MLSSTGLGDLCTVKNMKEQGMCTRAGKDLISSCVY